MKKNVVAIVGKPNVGKSTLFNRIIKERKAIVEDKPGVTRDRLYSDAEWLTRQFLLVDTGGITLKDELFSKEIKIQAEVAINEADVIIFVLSYKDGITEDDKAVAKILYKSKKPIILVVNKYDKKTSFDEKYEYMSLGFGEPILVSSTHGIGVGDLLDNVVSNLPKIDTSVKDNIVRITIIGKPNVGKSSLVNSILNEERMIVSDIAGTTIDSVDSHIKVNNHEYIIVDTAGLRKKSRIFENIEKYSYLKTVTSVAKSDIVIFLFDASDKISDYDTNIAGIAFEERKPILLLGNKWDLVKDKSTKAISNKEDEIRSYFKYLGYAHLMFISAIEKQRVYKIFDIIEKINNNIKKHIRTSVLNEILNKAQLINPAPNHNGGRLKILYASQVDAYLPTFVIFVNNPNYVHFSYKRFIENQIRANFDFTGVPINLIFRERK